MGILMSLRGEELAATQIRTYLEMATTFAQTGSKRELMLQTLRALLTRSAIRIAVTRRRLGTVAAEALNVEVAFARRVSAAMTIQDYRIPAYVSHVLLCTVIVMVVRLPMCFGGATRAWYSVRRKQTAQFGRVDMSALMVFASYLVAGTEPRVFALQLVFAI